MSVEGTRAVMERYWDGDDPTAIGADAVYTFMPTGEAFVGREAILGMMQRFYRDTFEVTPQDVTRHVGDGFALLESTLVGRHVGPFAGVAGTQRPVRVPMCVTYRVEGDAITGANVYFMASVALEQITD
jgi:hypothetical protein